jgi:hypothetical protein
MNLAGFGVPWDRYCDKGVLVKKLFLLLVLAAVGFAIYKAMNTETAAAPIPTDS